MQQKTTGRTENSANLKKAEDFERTEENIRALIRIGFGGMFYHNYKKEPPQNSTGNY